MSVLRLTPTLQDPAARVLLGGFVALDLLLAITGGGMASWTNWAAFGLTSAAAAAVVLAPRLGLAASTAVAASLVLSVALTVLPLRGAGWPGYLVWPLGASTFVSLALTLLRRIPLAWATMAGMCVVCTGWSLTQGAGPLPGLNLMIRQAGTLLIGTLFAVGLTRAARTVDALLVIERERSLQRALAAAEGTERRRTAEHVLGLASATLERLAREDIVEAADRAEMLALEGRLRDEITGSALLSDAWNLAAAAARRRGVDVVLLQDTPLDRIPPAVLQEAAAWLADRLDTAASPRFTARIVDRTGMLRVSARWEGGSAIAAFPYAAQ